MTRQKTIKATALASNFHNWLLHYEITQKELDDEFDGDEDQWLESLKTGGDCYLTETIDEGTGGDLEIDGTYIYD